MLCVYRERGGPALKGEKDGLRKLARHRSQVRIDEQECPSRASQVLLRDRHLLAGLVVCPELLCDYLQRGIELHERVLDCGVGIVA